MKKSSRTPVQKPPQNDPALPSKWLESASELLLRAVAESERASE